MSKNNEKTVKNVKKSSEMLKNRKKTVKIPEYHQKYSITGKKAQKISKNG